MNILKKSMKLVDEIFTKESIEKLKNEFYNYIDRVTEKPNDESKPVNRTEEMGDRLKIYESNFENVLDKDKPIIIRIDGHHFSKFTTVFKKPFDKLFREAMIRTTEDLHTRFYSYASYTQSDEITLYIPAVRPEESLHQFGGRTLKIASLASSYATIRFNKHLSNLLLGLQQGLLQDFTKGFYENDLHEYIIKISEKLNTAYFDARIFSVPDINEVTNVFIWRGRDCVKNSKSTFARAYTSHKELLNKNSEEQILLIKEKYNKDWNECDDMYKYGTLIKKELYEKEIDGNLCTRSKLKRKHINLSTYSEDLVKLIKVKHI